MSTLRSRARRAVALLACVLGIVSGCPDAVRAQDGADILRGRVRTPDGHPIPHASITIVGTASRRRESLRTDEEGRFTAVMPDADGDYVITARALGFGPRTVRFVRRSESRLISRESVLEPVAVRLEAVEVVGRGEHRDSSGIAPGQYDLLGGKLFSLDPSDVNALAVHVPGILTIPGVDGDPDGLSAFGQPADQNATSVDGSSFAGGRLPIEVISTANLATNLYDVSRGQFSGAQFIIGTRRGAEVLGASLRGTIGHPALAWRDPTFPAPLPLHLSLGGSVEGPLRSRAATFLLALDATRTLTEVQSLLDPIGRVLRDNGLARDTVDALAATLDGAGVPLAGDAPDAQRNDQLTGFLRVDLRASPTTTLSLRADGTWGRQEAIGIGPLGFPSQGSHRSADKSGLHLSGTMYVGGILSELRTYWQRTTAEASPYLSLPAGQVRVGTVWDDGREGFTSLGFGGAGSSIARTVETSWETTHELSWISPESRHRIKLGQQVTVTQVRARSVDDPFGRFTFNSLEDLAANRPASYTRTMSERSGSTRVLGGALWAGDEWTVSPRLALQLGVRADLSRPRTAPPYNPLADSLFGVRTDRVPGDFGISPRLGFGWTVWSPDAEREMALPFGERRYPVTLTGGIGAFRGTIQPGQIAGLADRTGLPSAARQLTCVGDATPAPDWAGYRADPATIPGECLDGTAPGPFGENRPRISVMDPALGAPVSWRGSLQLAGVRVPRLDLAMSVMHSLGRNQPGAVDLNLRRTAAAVLPEEGGRTMLVSPADIVPATGAIAPAAARIDDRFGEVASRRGDLRNEVTTLTLSATLARPLLDRIGVTAMYVHTRDRQQIRGFGGTTAGDPFAREWAVGPQPTHQATLQSFVVLPWVQLQLRLSLTSGQRYTPMVAGDINGDGQWNDRAFVFDPDATADPILAGQMADLLAAAPTPARECLRRSLGRVAAHHACSTGWQLRPDLSIRLDAERGVPIGERGEVNVRTENLVGALVRLLGLSSLTLSLAPDEMPPDPVLLYVDGFDADARSFTYRVNQQFGARQDAQRQRPGRFGGPFRLHLGAQIRFGGPSIRPMAQGLGLVPPSGGPPLTVDQVRHRLRARTSDPAAELLAMADSLALTPAQRTTLEARRAAFRAHIDSTLTPLAEHIVRRGNRLRDEDLRERLGDLEPTIRAALTDAARDAIAVLDDGQRARLPASLRSLVEVDATP